MPSTTSRPRPTSRQRTAPRPRPQPGRRGPAASARRGGIDPWRNALEGAAAALGAVVAMTAVVALSLALVGAGSAGSLWSLTMAVTAMAVGGSASSTPPGDAGSTGSELAGMFGGGGMSPSISGAAHAVPLGVTLVGTLVLWFAFSRRLRQRRFDGGELAVRAAGAGAAALIALMVVAGLARGTATLPMSAMGGEDGGQDAGGLGGLGGAFGGGGMGEDMEMAYEVNVGSAAFGALLWVGVVLAVGCVINRRIRLPLGGALDRVRDAWAPSLSAVVRTVLVLAAASLVPLVIIGALAGDRAGTAVGAALLVAPNAVVVFLTLGVGTPWTAGIHPVTSDSSSNPFASMMGGMGEGMLETDRTEHLLSLSAGGWPLWPVALTATGLLLLRCAHAAARAGNSAHLLPLHPYGGRLAPHLGMAERFGVVTAVVLGTAAWLAGASGNFGVSMFGSEMGGMRAELSGNALVTAVLGLLVGGLAGFAGSLLAARRGVRAAR